MKFTGFSQETLDFLWGILLNNNREWFLPHKADYQTYLYEPLKALALEVQEGMIAAYPEKQLNLKVTRIYRDVRRPHRDGPYKTHLWFVLHGPAEHWSMRPAFYFEISPGCWETGMGFYCSKPSMMEHYRKNVLEHPEKLEALALRQLERPEFRLEGEEYKRSKGEVSELLKPWFNRKNIALCHVREFEENDIAFTPHLVEQVVEDLKWLAPFYDYFYQLAVEAEHTNDLP